MIRTLKQKMAAFMLLSTLFLSSIAAWAQQSQVVHLDVQGMTCPLCVSMVNKVLRETPGVVSARTSLPKHEAVVVVQQGIDMDTLIAAVAKTGYTATVKSVEAQAAQE